MGFDGVEEVKTVEEIHKEIHKHIIGIYPHIDHLCIKGAFCHECDGPICADFWKTEKEYSGPSDINGNYWKGISNGKPIDHWTHYQEHICFAYLRRWQDKGGKG